MCKNYQSAASLQDEEASLLLLYFLRGGVGQQFAYAAALLRAQRSIVSADIALRCFSLPKTGCFVIVRDCAALPYALPSHRREVNSGYSTAPHLELPNCKPCYQSILESTCSSGIRV
jgi:hypothetical protein